MTRADRDRAHRQEVEKNKTRIRGLMREGGHIYGEETFRAATQERDYVEADALEELMPEIREHNARVGGGTKNRIQEYLDKERRREFQERQRRDEERAIEDVERYRRDHPAPNLDAVGQPEPEPESEPEDQSEATPPNLGFLTKPLAPPLPGPTRPRRKRRAINPY